jgi:hypothetical protein
MVVRYDNSACLASAATLCFLLLVWYVERAMGITHRPGACSQPLHNLLYCSMFGACELGPDVLQYMGTAALNTLPHKAVHVQRAKS